MPNEVYLLEPVLVSLSTPNLLWQTRYVLLLWLSLICLAPFDLVSIQSSTDGQNLVTRLIDLAKQGLRSAGNDRDASAVLCARILSRGDVWRSELQPFMAWAIDVFSSDRDEVLLVYASFSNLIIENRSLGCDLKCTHAFRKNHRSIYYPAVDGNPSPRGIPKHSIYCARTKVTS